MLVKVKKEIRERRDSVAAKILGGVPDFEVYQRLRGRHEAYSDALALIDQYGNLEEED